MDNSKLVIILPFILVNLTSMFCNPGSDAGQTVKFRPPKEAFIIVWPILLSLLGLAWYNSLSSWLLYTMLTICLCLWLIVYSCFKNKMGGVYTLLLTLLILLMTYTASNKTSQYLLCPLIVWIIFALLLNVFEI